MCNFVPQAPIQTERLLLRKLELSDAQEAFGMTLIPKVREFTYDLIPPSKVKPESKTLDLAPSNHTTDSLNSKVSKAISFVTSCREGPACYNFAVTLAQSTFSGTTRDGHLIGVLGCRNFPELGYVFHPTFHGQGYATEALRAFLPELWTHMPSALAAQTGDHLTGTDSEQHEATGTKVKGYDYLVAHCITEHVASQRVLEKVGFVRGSVVEKMYVNPQGVLRDSVAYLLLRPGLEFADVVPSLNQEERSWMPASVLHEVSL